MVLLWLRHNDKVCNDVEKEPPLQPLPNEHLERGPINTDSVRPDVRARVFWRRGQNAFIDLRVTNPGAVTQAQTSVEKIVDTYEREKNKGLQRKDHECGARCLHPLVFTVFGGMDQKNEKYHKYLAEKIAKNVRMNTVKLQITEDVRERSLFYVQSYSG